MNIDEAMAVIHRGRLESLYVVTGPNDFWRAQWLAAARQKFLGLDGAMTGCVRIDNPQDVQAVELELQGGTLFDQRKMVVVDGGRFKKDEWVQSYSEHPIPDTLLVLLEDKASAALEKAAGKHRLVLCESLSVPSFGRFVNEEARARGVVWDSAAAERFCRIVEGNEFLAVQELEKLALMFPDRVTLAEVVELVKPLRADDKPWDATDALLRRDGPAAVQALMAHLASGMAPLFLFVIMARQVILIDRARRAAGSGMTAAQFQTAEGLRDFVAKKVWSARRLYSDDEMDRLLTWAHQVDVAMKTGYGEPDVWLLAWTALWAYKKSPRSTRGANV